MVQVNPRVEALLQELWASDASDRHSFWHSIWVHWRDPDPALLRAIHSKRAEAWQQVRPLRGSGHVVECLDGLHFSFGPASFQQVNLQVFEKILQDMKLALMELLGDIGRNDDGRLRILELCSGVGVIGLSLAHAASQDLKVSLLSTDVNPNCADLFHENAKRTFPEEQDCDVKFSACTAAEALAALASDGADVLVIDPPRRGLADRRLRQRLEGGEDQAAAICNSGVQAVIYMSCGHDSFMADAERLMSGTNAGAFQLKSLSCYDMFPYTPHLEILGIFRRNQGTRPAIRRDVRANTVQAQADQGQKLQCQFIIGIEQDRAFNVKQRLLGTRGHHVKLIAQRADCKLRLRGWGSGFKEGPRRRESMDPLMLCISSKNESKHREAVELVQGLVEDVYQQYRSFKDARGEVAPELKVQINHGPRPGSRTRWTT